MTIVADVRSNALPSANVKCEDVTLASEELSEALAILKGGGCKANRERISQAAELIEKAKKWYYGHVIREPEVVRA